MHAIPDVHPLPRTHRRIIFITALLVFAIAVPLVVFYAVGYRFDFSGEVSNIKGVGGMYVTSDDRAVEMYLNGEIVDNIRVFQNASYIQNLEAGIHQIHVQGDGVQTWVKDLPVQSHFVTEAQSFNLPIVPQLRLVTEWNTSDGNAVIFQPLASTTLAAASTTNTIFVASTTATTTYDVNPEYVYVTTLFASSTEEAKLLEEQKRMSLGSRFTFSTATTAATTTVATTTKVFHDIRLAEVGDEVYAEWTGEDDEVPYYFCVQNGSSSTIAALYGQHVYDGLIAEYGTSSNLTNALYLVDNICRTKIRIDRLWQEVHWFDFYPNSRDKVLMLLDDGLYVVEVDDRSWQNTQMLYPGVNLEVVLDGGRIFVTDGEYIFQVFTEIEE